MDDLKEIWNGSLEKGLFQDHWMSRLFSTKNAEGTAQVSWRNKKCITLVCSKDTFSWVCWQAAPVPKLLPLFQTHSSLLGIWMLSPRLCWPYFPFASSFLLGSSRRGCQRETGERKNFPPIPVNVRLTHSPPAADEFTSGFSNLSNLPVTPQRPQHKRLAPSFSVTCVPYYGAPLQAQSHQHEWPSSPLLNVWVSVSRAPPPGSWVFISQSLPPTLPTLVATISCTCYSDIPVSPLSSWLPNTGQLLSTTLLPLEQLVCTFSQQALPVDKLVERLGRGLSQDVFSEHRRCPYVTYCVIWY